ncbi:hypothetical protein [Quadrisphaera sp. DSM 44207]|uniref:hypothetical protein n=1 Tax=Quadrisphaera sp. DSM 44207 TaxID=1881057 RepID=UPI000880A1FF|nr:hypothetical protein [Quadrisphaera sp. DSM 44207]SDQ64501.1 hypothetical protein SAMN05428996_2216 [Quadrisphaera sp. DSM 44207]
MTAVVAVAGAAGEAGRRGWRRRVLVPLVAGALLGAGCGSPEPAPAQEPSAAPSSSSAGSSPAGSSPATPPAPTAPDTAPPDAATSSAPAAPGTAAPGTSEPAAGWPGTVAPTAGQRVSAVYLDVVVEGTEQERLDAAEAAAASVGYDATTVEMGCDEGAEATLQLDPAKRYTGAALYFPSAEEAQRFVDRYEPGVVGTAQVSPFCVD